MGMVRVGWVVRPTWCILATASLFGLHCKLGALVQEGWKGARHGSG